MHQNSDVAICNQEYYYKLLMTLLSQCIYSQFNMQYHGFESSDDLVKILNFELSAGHRARAQCGDA